MLGRNTEIANRQRRAARAAEKAPSGAVTGTRNIPQKAPSSAAAAIKATDPKRVPVSATLQQHLLEKQVLSGQPYSESKNKTFCMSELARPQTEATRCYYERLIARGISLLQPYSVLFLAESYHGWYHCSSADIAGNVLQQTIGYNRRPVDHTGIVAYDIRSVYWLALCHWHLGEVSSVYSLLSPAAIETEFIIERGDNDYATVTKGSASNSDHESNDVSATAVGESGESSCLLLSVFETSKAHNHRALACALWLLAMSCTRLEKWQEAEDHLNTLSETLKQIYLPDEPGNAAGIDIKHAIGTNTSLYALPTFSDVADLLGLVCIRTNRMAQSEAHSTEALQRNPLLWSSCRRLCELGSKQGLSRSLNDSLGHLGIEKQTQRSRLGYLSDRTPMQSSRQNARNQGTSDGYEKNVNQQANIATTTAKSRKTDSRQAHKEHRHPTVASTSLGDSVTSTRTRARMAAQPMFPGAGNISSSSVGSARSITGRQTKVAVGATSSLKPGSVATHVLANTPRKLRVEVLATTDKKRTRNGSAIRPVSLNRARDTATGSVQQGDNSSSSSQEGGQSETIDGVAASHLYQLIKHTGVVCMNMLSYRAPEALVAFSKLPVEQQNSAWGLCMLGRICFEAGRYPEAAQSFSGGHQLAPFRVRDMDIYSTLLWHMKREEALAHLAHTMISAGRNWSPEAWITVANCFSLDGDHSSALKSLSRSVQLYKASHGGITVVPRSDSGGVSGLAYVHTLVGHENVANGEFDRAQQAFRTAIRIDPRHYNAWYGMGMSYLRLGKLDLAEYHFRRALALNSQNPLLLQSAGAIYEHRGEFEKSLSVYERVEELLQKGYTTNASKFGLDDQAENGQGNSALITDEGVVLGLQTHHAMNFVLFKRARVLVILERFADAAVILEKLLQRCPREFNVPFLLGQTYTKLHRYREAAACLTRALDVAPENIQSVREAFDALYMQDADDQEARAQEQADRSNAGDVSMLVSGAHGQGSSSRANNMETPLARLGGMAGPSSMLSSSTSTESPYFESPSLYAGRRGQMDWRSDWRSLNNADDRVDRALDFDM